MTKQELIKQVRSAFADYCASEGCSCCEIIAEHKEAKDRLGKLLDVEKYNDDGGDGMRSDVWEAIAVANSMSAKEIE